MKVLDLISQLQAIASQHGNLEVRSHDGDDPSDLEPVKSVFMPYSDGKPECIILLP